MKERYTDADLFLSSEKMDTFYTSEEINALLEKIQANKEDTESKNKIFQSILKSVLKSNSQLLTSVDKDDYVSISFSGIMKAINSFDISKNVKFLTFACYVVRNDLLLHIRNQKTKNKYIVSSLDEPKSSQTSKEG